MGRRPRLLDISRSLSPATPVYPGDPPLRFEPVMQIGADCPCSLTQLVLSTHTGTHLDPPSHFLPGGASLDQLSLERFLGPALVVAVEGNRVEPGHLEGAHLRGRSLAGANVLFRTRDSERPETEPFGEDFASISGEAAALAVSLGVNLVGVDSPSVDPFGSEDFPAHRALLGAGVLILEGLYLGEVDPGWYTLVAFPLKISGGDGSPLRAVLIDDGAP